MGNRHILAHLHLAKQVLNYDPLHGQIINSNRCKINNHVFHSLNYLKRGKTNSFTVSFDKNNEEKFCFIKNFFSLENDIYAVVNILSVDNNLYFSLSLKFSKWINNLLNGLIIKMKWINN